MAILFRLGSVKVSELLRGTVITRSMFFDSLSPIVTLYSGSGNGLLLDGTKRLHEPLLTVVNQLRLVKLK